MGLFSQYSVSPTLNTEIKPISLTGNSVLTSKSMLSYESQAQSKPITYTPPKLDTKIVNSINSSWNSFFEKSNTQALQNDILAENSKEENNYNLEQPKKNNTKTYIIGGISVVGIILLSVVFIKFIKHKNTNK